MIRLATRRSPLALKQAELAARLIERRSGKRVEILPLSSLGDEDQVRPLARFLQPGAFTGRLDEALQNDEADVAVHSLKDVPLTPARGLSRTYIIERGDPADRLVVASGMSLETLSGRRVGTSAPRRRSQLDAHSPEAIPIDVRGSIDTRLQRIADGELDVLFVAAAALDRGRNRLPPGAVPHRLPLTTWPTAPGQGALALQAQQGSAAERLLGTIEDGSAARAVAAERGLLGDLGGGCGTPLGATCIPAGHPEGDPDHWSLHVTYPGRDHGLRRATLRASDPSGCREEALEFIQDPLTSASTPNVQPPQVVPPTLHRILLVMDPDRPSDWQGPLEAAGHQVTFWWPFRNRDLVADDDRLQERLRNAYLNTDWVLVTSARAVPACSLMHKTSEHLPRFAAVGPGTARALRAAELPVTLMPSQASGTDVARLLARRVERDGTGRILWMSGTRVTRATEDALLTAGLEVTRIAVYDVAPIAIAPPDRAHDVVLFTSPHAARHALRLVHSLLSIPTLVAIGPTTADALAELDHQPIVLPAPTPTSFLDTLRSR